MYGVLITIFGVVKEIGIGMGCRREQGEGRVCRKCDLSHSRYPRQAKSEGGRKGGFCGQGYWLSVGGGRKEKKAWCPWDWKHIWFVLLIPESWAGELEFSSLVLLGVVCGAYFPRFFTFEKCYGHSTSGIWREEKREIEKG